MTYKCLVAYKKQGELHSQILAVEAHSTNQVKDQALIQARKLKITNVIWVSVVPD